MRSSEAATYLAPLGQAGRLVEVARPPLGHGHRQPVVLQIDTNQQQPQTAQSTDERTEITKGPTGPTLSSWDS